MLLSLNLQHFLENLDPFKGMSVTEISNYVYEESKRIEPKNCRQPLKFVSILSAGKINRFQQPPFFF